MTSLTIEIQVITDLLVYLGEILTAKIYDSSKRLLQLRKLFDCNTLINPYCIISYEVGKVMQGIAYNRYFSNFLQLYDKKRVPWNTLYDLGSY